EERLGPGCRAAEDRFDAAEAGGAAAREEIAPASQCEDAALSLPPLDPSIAVIAVRGVPTDAQVLRSAPAAVPGAAPAEAAPQSARTPQALAASQANAQSRLHRSLHAQLHQRARGGRAAGLPGAPVHQPSFFGLGTLSTVGRRSIRRMRRVRSRLPAIGSNRGD